MQSTSICNHCNISFKPTPGSKGLFCSVICTHASRRINAAKLREQTRTLHEIEYLKIPTTCHNCQKALPWKQRKNKFCSSSCSAIRNTTGRVRSEESKKAISAKMKNLYATREHKQFVKSGNQHPGYKDGSYMAKLRHCVFCNIEFEGTRKTCSRDCYLEYNRKCASEHLRKNRHKYVGPHQRSWMERSFVEWLESHGIHQGIYGYKDQVHFKYNLNNKTKNGWADFVFVSRKLIIELDGNHHNKRKDLDQLRDAHLLQERGYTVVRITHAEYRKQSRIEEIKNLLDIKPCN